MADGNGALALEGTTFDYPNGDGPILDFVAPTGEATQGSEAAMYCNNLNAHLPRDHSSSVSGMMPM